MKSLKVLLEKNACGKIRGLRSKEIMQSGNMRNMNNIMRHELIGLECCVECSKNKAQTGIEGRITDETIKMLVIGGKRVPKKDSVFVVKLNGEKVHIDGNAIIARPEDRIKKKIRKW